MLCNFSSVVWFFCLAVVVSGESITLLGNAPNLGTAAGSTGEPDLPEINGAFDLEFKVRFESIDSQYQNLFEYAQAGGAHRVLVVQSYDIVRFVVSNSTTLLSCYPWYTRTPTFAGQVYHYHIGVNLNGGAYVNRDGQQLVGCAGMHLPHDVDRDKYLGNGPTSSSVIGPLRGAILGMQVLHHGILNSLPGKYEFLNLPGQAFDHSFEVTFFARFDNINGRNSQRIFEFGNTGGADAIWCGQVNMTNSMECGMIEDGVEYTVTAPGAIDQGTFSSWKFTVDSSGTFRIAKNGQQLSASQTSIIRKHVFRKKQLFGASDAVGQGDLFGAVVGFRLQPFADGS